MKIQKVVILPAWEPSAFSAWEEANFPRLTRDGMDEGLTDLERQNFRCYCFLSEPKWTSTRKTLQDRYFSVFLRIFKVRLEVGRVGGNPWTTTGCKKFRQHFENEVLSKHDWDCSWAGCDADTLTRVSFYQERGSSKVVKFYLSSSLKFFLKVPIGNQYQFVWKRRPLVVTLRGNTPFGNEFLFGACFPYGTVAACKQPKISSLLMESQFDNWSRRFTGLFFPEGRSWIASKLLMFLAL